MAAAVGRGGGGAARSRLGVRVEGGAQRAEGGEGEGGGLAAEAVDALAAVGLAVDEAGVAEQGEVGGDAGLLQVEAAGEVADGGVAGPEGVDQADAGLVGEDPGQRGDALLVRHGYILHPRCVMSARPRRPGGGVLREVPGPRGGG